MKYGTFPVALALLALFASGGCSSDNAAAGPNVDASATDGGGGGGDGA